jgi:osmotically inducible protein OsmC
LLAARHASCYAMALNATLSVGRHEPQQLDVTARVSLDRKDGGRFRISSSELMATGVVPGLDRAGFQEAAEQGEQACPISNSLRNVLMTVKATMES